LVAERADGGFTMNTMARCARRTSRNHRVLRVIVLIVWVPSAGTAAQLKRAAEVGIPD
jgi:hypothetical protein